MSDRELLEVQWQHNHMIKERNIELEKIVNDLRFQVKELSRQLEEYKIHYK